MDYKIDNKVIGSGMSGPVQLATGADGVKYAVKSFKKQGLSARRRADLKNEVEIYLALDHPHIARLIMVYETDEEIHLVMEFMEGGELYDRLSSRKTYTEELAADTAYQMLIAVAYLHANQIAHRDLKLENFLYEKKTNDHLKLIDFGFAKFWDRSTMMSQACGSVHYVAPEVLAHAYTNKADMWSLGVITYMLLTGSPPFHGTDTEVLKKVRAGMPHFSSRFKRLSEPAQDFVKALMVVDAETRLSAEGALDHPWIKSKDRGSETLIDDDIKMSLRNFARASHFRRAVLSMMAWSLSNEDRAELRQHFLALDKENKGTITHKQMKQILEEHYHIDSVEAEAVFNSMDTDHDNEIAYSEFLAAALQGRVKVYEDVLRKTFSKFDQDDCGLITFDDLRKILGDDFEESELQEMIREVDKNGDGQIQYDEFLEYFHQADSDALSNTSQDKLDEKQEQPPEVVKRRVKHTATQKLGLVIDKLLADQDQSPTSPTSPISPNPLARRANKAKTMPVHGSLRKQTTLTN